MKINFKATKVFQEIWKSVLSQKYKLIVEEGSSRSSKTWSNFQVLFLYMFENPFTTATVLRDTQKSCREIVETDWIKWLSDPQGRKLQLEKKEITVQQFDEYIKQESLLKYFIRNKTNHTWTFKHNNSFLRFTGLDDEDDAMGMTQDICWINEPYNFSHEVYKQLSQRTSKFILFDWNPKQSHWVNDEKKKDNTKTLYSTFLDNPFCPKESKIQILSYQPLAFSEVVMSSLISETETVSYNIDKNELGFTAKQLKELERCIYNEKVGSASAYHWQVYGLGLKAEKPNRIFTKWIRITSEEYDSLPYNPYFGLDIGTAKPSALAECRFDGQDSFFIRKRLYMPINEMEAKDTNLSKTMQDLKIKKSDIVVIDPAAKDERQDLVRNGYNIIGANKGSGSVMGGINLMKKFKIYYVPDEDLDNEYENYEWEIVQGVNLDRPIKKDDHLLDATRYVITWLCKYLSIE